MPKAKGLDPAVVNAMLADETDPANEPRDIAPTPAPPAYVPETPPVVAPVAPAPALDVAALVQMLAAAMQSSGQSTADAIKAGLADAASMARTPKPENQDAPDISVYTRPDGSRTLLRCPMFLGVYNEHGKVVPAFEYLEGTLTEKERAGLNALQSGTFTVERNDGEPGLVRVHESRDDLGVPIRLVIAVPFIWLQKELFSQVPSLVRMLDQLRSAEAVAA